MGAAAPDQCRLITSFQHDHAMHQIRHPVACDEQQPSRIVSACAGQYAAGGDAEKSSAGQVKSDTSATVVSSECPGVGVKRRSPRFTPHCLQDAGRNIGQSLAFSGALCRTGSGRIYQELCLGVL